MYLHVSAISEASATNEYACLWASNRPVFIEKTEKKEAFDIEQIS